MKIRIPLSGRAVSGIACPFPEVTLRVRDRYGGLAELPFRIDTAADFSAIPMAFAQREGIPYRQSAPSQARGLAGAVATFRDRIRVVIGGREHEWPCDFVTLPTLAGPGRAPPELTPVLGRAGFLQEYAFCMDDEYLVLTRLGAVRRWWRGQVYRLWERLGLVHGPDQAL
jgi:hypothetical protein